MKHVLVYRLEHKTKKHGIYSYWDAYEIINEWLIDQNCANRHPNAEHDKLLQDNARRMGYSSQVGMGGSVRFGFKDMKQLRDWFFENIIFEELKEVDIVFTVYKVPEEAYIEGHRQCVFLCEYHKDRYRVLETDLLDLIDKITTDDHVLAAIESYVPFVCMDESTPEIQPEKERKYTFNSPIPNELVNKLLDDFCNVAKEIKLDRMVNFNPY